MNRAILVAITFVFATSGVAFLAYPAVFRTSGVMQTQSRKRSIQR
jgi:hypothetical protein